MKRISIFVCALVALGGCGSTGSGGSSLSATDPSVLQKPGWPDMTVLDNYPNPHGDSCFWDGTSYSGNPEAGEKATEDEHKNRFRLPAKPDPMKFSDILKLPAEGDGPDQERGVTVVAYVRSVAPAGTSGEACNCQEKTRSLCDAHIELVLDPANEDDGHGVVIAEVTERGRRLAQAGLLATNIGNDWSTDMLDSAITHKWVRFTGWLFYDTDHEREDWESNPDGTRNWRETCWEVHPVMGIEVLPGKPPEAG
jgi:hypothetical protein